MRKLSCYYEKRSRNYEKNYVAARVVRTRVMCLVVLVRREDPRIYQVPVLKMFHNLTIITS